MKKQLLALVVALSTTVSFAATAPQAQGSNPAQGTPFEKAEQLYNQKNYPAAYQEIDRLAKTGNAQAIYNLGFMTELGQGTKKIRKKLYAIMKKPRTRAIQLPLIDWPRFIRLVIWA